MMKTRRRERVTSSVKLIKNRRRKMRTETEEAAPKIPEPKEIWMEFDNFAAMVKSAAQDILEPVKAYPPAGKVPVLMAVSKEEPETTMKEAVEAYFRRDIERICLDEDGQVIIVFTDGDE